jgi:hypothetical protein
MTERPPRSQNAMTPARSRCCLRARRPLIGGAADAPRSRPDDVRRIRTRVARWSVRRWSRPGSLRRRRTPPRRSCTAPSSGSIPIQSLQRVIPIHGMPSIEGRTMVALLQSRVATEFNWLEKSDTSVACSRAGSAGRTPLPMERPSGTIERGDARRIRADEGRRRASGSTNANGKLLGNMKYITDPQAMLKAKCQAEVCRDLAPEILMGISYARPKSWSRRTGIRARHGERAPADVGADHRLTRSWGHRILSRPLLRSRSGSYPSGTRKRESEPVDADVVADPEPTPDPEPVDAPSDPGSKPETPQIEEPAADEDCSGSVRNRAIRKLFALLAKAGDHRTGRPARHLPPEPAAARGRHPPTTSLPTTSSTSSQGLEVHDKRGDLAQCVMRCRARPTQRRRSSSPSRHRREVTTLMALVTDQPEGLPTTNALDSLPITGAKSLQIPAIDASWVKFTGTSGDLIDNPPAIDESRTYVVKATCTKPADLPEAGRRGRTALSRSWRSTPATSGGRFQSSTKKQPSLYSVPAEDQEPESDGGDSDE